MATLAELVKGFRANVRAGYPTTLLYNGMRASLTCATFTNGFIGSCKVSRKKVIGFMEREQFDMKHRSAEVAG